MPVPSLDQLQVGQRASVLSIEGNALLDATQYAALLK